MQMLPMSHGKKGETFTLRPYQEEAVQKGVAFFERKGGQNEIIMAPTGCHAKGALILMADGTAKKVEDVVVGDRLKCPTTWGEKTVLQLCRGREKMYRVHYGRLFDSARVSHVVNGGHVLHLCNIVKDGRDSLYLDVTNISVSDFVEKDDDFKKGLWIRRMSPDGMDYMLHKISIEPLEEDDYYGFTLDGDHLYMTSDFIIHHNSGKSLIISGICERLPERILVLQPSQEILKQNYAKFVATGSQAGIYSASVGRKDMDRVTFASIQTVMSKSRDGRYLNVALFLNYQHIILDEAHISSNAKGSQLLDLLNMIAEKTGKQPKVLGLTATPFRLFPCTDRHGNNDSMLKMLTRTRPKIFGHLSHWIQIRPLLEQGYLATPRYFDVRNQLSHGFDRSKVKVNSTGADYDEKSLQEYFDTIEFKEDIVKIVQRINKAGRQVLVFMGSVSDAYWVSGQLRNSATVTGETPNAERKQIEADFKAGKLMSVCNMGVWTTGFDYPELKCVLLARPLRSLSMYYQMLGRALRPHKGDEAWLVDATGNFPVFGRIEDLELSHDDRNLPILLGSNGKLLTGVPLKEQEVHIADGGMKEMTKKKPSGGETAYEAMMRRAREHAGITV